MCTFNNFDIHNMYNLVLDRGGTKHIYIKRGPPSQNLGYRQTPVYEDSGPQIMNHRVPYI